MGRALIERRLKETSDRLRKAREDLAVTEEQLLSLADDADDARLRAIVSDAPMAEAEHRSAERHASAMRRHRDDLTTEIAKLEAAQDELLDRFVADS